MKRFAAVLLCAAASVRADPLVVGDAACPLHAVDIAAFATCDGERVAAHGRAAPMPTLLPEAAVPAFKRTAGGLYVDARGGHRMKSDAAQRAVLVDIRSRLEAGLTGQPANVDVHVPYADTALPLRWDDERGSWATTPNAAFAHELTTRLARLGVERDRPVLLLCRTGVNSARAADELAALGYTRVISVVDGFEGDVDADGRRTVNGWKNAGLPWTARPLAVLGYGTD